jgi:DNA primase
MNSKQAKQIPIEHFLNKLNHKPVKSSGNDLWYKSPLHEDNTPSFKVNKILNSWYDFGISEGGSIIDLVCTMFNDNVSQA